MPTVEILEIAETLRYTGFNDLAIDPDGNWISPAAEAYEMGWKLGALFVWSGPQGYEFRRAL